MDVIKESRRALKRLDWSQVDNAVTDLRVYDRVFCIGNGGGYAHATHFASDLRKIAGKQAISFDNAAEMTARINDDGWANAWVDWLKSWRFTYDDVLFVFSVGGGTPDTSLNFGRPVPCTIRGIMGTPPPRSWLAREGYPIIVPSTSTPVIEGCQSVIAHHIVEQLCK